MEVSDSWRALKEQAPESTINNKTQDDHSDFTELNGNTHLPLNMKLIRQESLLYRNVW